MDVIVDTLEEAMTLVEECKAKGEPKSIGLIANAADVFPELVLRGVVPDVVTDQTPAHDPLMYVPNGMTLEQAADLRQRDPAEYSRQSHAGDGTARPGDARLSNSAAAWCSTMATTCASARSTRASRTPLIIRALSRLTSARCSAKAKGRSAGWRFPATSKTCSAPTKRFLNCFPNDKRLERWIRMAQKRVAFQGLPARICWLGYGERDKAGLRFNELVAKGEVSAPIVIGRDHLDAGSVASPRRETEGMRDGSDAIADWPLLNALINAVGGATWVSIHHGGGVGIGYQHPRRSGHRGRRHAGSGCAAQACADD